MTSRSRIALRAAVTATVLSVVASAAYAGERSLGPLSITGKQTLSLQFIGTGAAGPFPIAVQFLDAAGAVVASSGGPCTGDVCSPTGLLMVDTARVTTLSINGAITLGLSPDETMTIQPVVSAAGAGHAHLLTAVEISHDDSAARLAIRFDPASARLQLPSSVTTGPLTLGRGELARFTIVHYRPQARTFTMFFVNAHGDRIGAETAVTLRTHETATIELDGDVVGIAGVPGVIRGDTDFISADRVAATLEILDKATGSVKAVLASGGTSTGGGTGSGDGGAGGS